MMLRLETQWQAALVVMIMLSTFATGCGMLPEDDDRCAKYQTVRFEVVVINQYYHAAGVQVNHPGQGDVEYDFECYDEQTPTLVGSSSNFVPAPAQTTSREEVEVGAVDGAVTLRFERGYSEIIVEEVSDGDVVTFVIGEDESFERVDDSESGSQRPGRVVFGYARGELAPRGCSLDRDVQVELEGYGRKPITASVEDYQLTCGSPGAATFEGVTPGLVNYTLYCDGTPAVEGTTTVHEGNCTEEMDWL